MSDGSAQQVRVPPGRLERWVTNFHVRHGDGDLDVVDGELRGSAADGSCFRVRLPFGRRYAGPPEPAGVVAAAAAPEDWGVLLVRKGGFAVARCSGGRVVAHKIGQRHVQGRSKAGGWSQQRFARRREQQARVAYEAAADHAARILADLTGPLAVGGDRAAVDEVLTDRRLSGLTVAGALLAVPDPRRDVLDRAVHDAMALLVDVRNA